VRTYCYADALRSGDSQSAIRASSAGTLTIQELHEEVRNDLAADLGREPDNYRADQYFSPVDYTDGGSD
jgi:hypothetical protein